MPLKVSDGIGAWIKDFQKSDAPQFKGKSKDERRDQAVAAYLSAKRGDQKEAVKPSFGHHADTMKKKMMTPSDKNKLLKIRQMLDKEKKPVKKEDVAAVKQNKPLQNKLDKLYGPKRVKKEAMTPAQKAAHDKAMADFKARGGKITKLPPGKAAGYHGKDDPGKGMHGMLAKGSAKKLGLRKHGKHLDTSTPIHRESVQEDFMFKVGVEGLPDMIIGGSSPGDIKARLRKIVKQPSMITSVDRMTSAEVKKRYRDMAQGKEETNEEKGRGPTGIAYSVPKGHPDAENPATRKKYPERQTPAYKKKFFAKSTKKETNEETINESINFKGTDHISLTRYAAQGGFGLQLTQNKRMGNDKFRLGAHVKMPMKDVPKLITALQKVMKAPKNAQLGDDD